MPKWGEPWGELWGCDADDVSLLDICDRYVWWQDHQHPNINKLCRIIAETYSEVHDKLQVDARTRGVELSAGGDLDNWGALVGQRRNGLGDVLYRKVIKAKARSMLSNGTIGDLFDVVTQIAPNSNVRFAPAFPACIVMVLEELTNAERTVVFDLMKPDLTSRNFNSPLPLGVCLTYIEVDPEGVFEFSFREVDNSLFPVDLHWGHTDGDIDPTQTAGMAFKIG